MVPSSPAISMEEKGSQLVVEIQSEDGQKYKVTAGGVGIDIEYGEKVVSYTTEKEKGMSTNIDFSVIEEFLDKDKTLCQTPTSITTSTKFPNFLAG